MCIRFKRQNFGRSGHLGDIFLSDRYFFKNLCFIQNQQRPLEFNYFSFRFVFNRCLLMGALKPHLLSETVEYINPYNNDDINLTYFACHLVIFMTSKNENVSW